MTESGRWSKRLASTAGAGLVLACAGGDATGPEDEPEGVPVTWASVTVGVGALYDFTCGLTDEGAGYCWGDGTSGKLGDGRTHTNGSGVPRPVAVAGDISFDMISAGWQHTCGLDPGGRAYCWGAEGLDEHVGGTGSRSVVPVRGDLIFSTLSAANFYTCGLAATGTAFCWDGEASVPTAVAGDLQFRTISVGNPDICGVSDDGTGYCWERNRSSEDGSGSPADGAGPSPVPGDLEFRDIATRSYNGCGITENGAAYCWGDFVAASPEPVLVTGGHSFVTLSVGSEHACALTAAGAAYCWGLNTGGKLGDGSDRVRSSVPVAVAGGITFRTIAAGGSHTCGTSTHGAAYCWGENDSGQLGDGSFETRRVPTPVANPRNPNGGESI